MNAKLAHVANRIRSELTELEEVVRRVEEGWKRAEGSGDDYYLDGVALNLDGLYSGNDFNGFNAEKHKIIGVPLVL